MPLILFECALHRFRQKPPNWTILIKVIFKFTLALKLWLACTIFSAIILLHLQNHSSRNYSLIFLLIFTLTFLVLSPTNTPRMNSQSVQSIPQFLRSFLTIQPTSLKYFYTFFSFYATPSFTTRTSTGRYKKAAGGERPTTCTCPWQVILSPKNPPLLARAFTRCFHSTADHSSICRRNSRRSKKVWLFQPIKAACSSKRALSPAADGKCSSHRSPTRTVGRSQSGRKSVELCTRIQLAPYNAGWHLATFLAPIVTGRNNFVDLQPKTPRRPSYSRLQVPGWEGPPYFHPAEFQSLLAFVPTLPTEQARTRHRRFQRLSPGSRNVSS